MFKKIIDLKHNAGIYNILIEFDPLGIPERKTIKQLQKWANDIKQGKSVTFQFGSSSLFSVAVYAKDFHLQDHHYDHFMNMLGQELRSRDSGFAQFVTIPGGCIDHTDDHIRYFIHISRSKELKEAIESGAVNLDFLNDLLNKPAPKALTTQPE